MTTHQILVQLRDLLADPKRWTKHQMARTETNYPVSPLSEEAAKWCLLGGLCKITNDNRGFSSAYIGARLALRSAAESTVAAFNDYAIHEDVMAAIDRAIVACQY